MATRVIGGVTYTIREVMNYLGQQYVVVADIDPADMPTLGAPDSVQTYAMCQDVLYMYNGTQWVKFYGTGDPGPAGPPNTLSIGTVTSLAAGSSATASISGTAPNQTLSLGIPRGTNGTNGSNNTLSIGTVTTLSAGASATATITGASPTQTLNLGIPVGQAGASPSPNSLSIGTVTALAAGSSPTASITGSAPSQTLNLGIPAGASGNNGANNTLAIGTVSTLAAGASATASITGSSPNQTLNLSIPQGQKGDAGTNGAGSIYRQSSGLAATARVWVGTATTNASGVWSVDYSSAGFTAAPIVQAQPVASGTAAVNLSFANPQSISATACSGIAGAGAAVSLLGGLGVGLLGAGVTIHVVAIGI